MATSRSFRRLSSIQILQIIAILFLANEIFCNEEHGSGNEDYASFAHGTVDDDYIYNLTAKAVDDHEFGHDFLQYYISWEVAIPTRMAIKIFKTPMEIGQEPLFEEITNDTEIHIPIQHDTFDEQLEAGHTYRIRVSDDKGHITEINHTIPECINMEECCRSFRRSINKNVTLNYEGNSTFRVQWSLPTNQNEPAIKNITIEYYKSKAELSVAPNEEELMVPHHEFPTDTSALVYSNSSDNMTLMVTFTDFHDCHDVIVRNLIIPPDPPPHDTWINLTSTVILVILLLVVIAFWYIDKCRGTIKAILISRFLNRRRRISGNNIYGNVGNRLKCIQSNVLYIDDEIIQGLTDSYELPRNHLKLSNEIGKGAFGEVYLGEARINGKELRVAVKTLRAKSSNEEMDDFLSEIEIMKKIGRHPNIVTMLKSCTLQEPYMMVMEYLPFGDLKHYLVNLREKWYNKRTALENHTNDSAPYITPNSPESPNCLQVKKTRPSTSTEYTNLSVTPTSIEDTFTFDLEQVLDHTELQNFAFQIASGMAHLEKIPITHRDLAARNILIDEHKMLKISDFGLSRPGPYINKSRNKLPLRWMALEAIEDHLYDNKSDVWSFGIVLWEIGTLGAFPYGDVPDRMLIYHLQMGKRLPRPEICTDELYSLMLRCWSADPQLRPTFGELVQQLDVTKTRIYIDFTQLNPLYVFPPTKAQHKKEIKQNQTNIPKYLECP